MTPTQIIAWSILVLHIVVLILQLLVMVVGLRVIRAIAREVGGWALAGREHARSARETTEQLVQEVHAAISPGSSLPPLPAPPADHDLPPSPPQPIPPSSPRGAPHLAVVLALAALGATAAASRVDLLDRHETTNPPAEATAVNPQAADLTSRGLARMTARDYRGAALDLEQAFVAGADAILTLGAAAECLYHLGDLDRALLTCDRLAAFSPNAGRAHTVRGLVLLRKGDRPSAAEEFRAAARAGDRLALTLLPQTEG